MKHQTGKSLKTVFKRGLAALLPTILTVWILKWFFGFFWNLSKTINQSVLSPLIAVIASHPEYIDPNNPSALPGHLGMNIAAFLLSILVVLVLGFLLMSLVGRRVWGAAEKHLSRVPVIRAIYPHVKQLTDFFLSKEQMEFRHACSIEYPRKGIWSLGFVTGPGLKTIESQSGERLVAVFVPSSPSPVTGYVIYVPAKEIIHLPLTTEQMFRITVSGGVIPPLHEVAGSVPYLPETAAGKEPENIKIDTTQESR